MSRPLLTLILVGVLASPAMALPDWAKVVPEAPDAYNVVGISGPVRNVEFGRKQAMASATAQLLRIIGFKASLKFSSSKSLQGTMASHAVVDTSSTIDEAANAELKGITSEAMDVEHQSDGRSIVYVLMKMTFADVEAARMTINATGDVVPAQATAPLPTTGSLTIRSTHDPAFVFLDGSPAGFTPLDLPQVLPGTHDLLVKRQGFREILRHVEVVASSSPQVEMFDLRL